MPRAELTKEDGELIVAVSEAVLSRRNMPTPREAIACGKTLMGCYRGRDFVDADVFATALTAAFSEYPSEVCRLVCDPVCGLPGKLKFPPSIAEVHEEARLWLRRFKYGAMAVAMRHVEPAGDVSR